MVYWVILVVTNIALSSVNGNDRVREKLYVGEEGALLGSVFAVLHVVKPIDCAFQCTQEPQCKSYNLQTNAFINQRCELNNQTKSNINTTSFVAKQGFTYYEAEPPIIKELPRQTGKPFNFTNLGASGRLGPTSLGDYYKGQPHELQVRLVSGIQYWTVPTAGQYRIEAVGASGGYDRQTKAYRGRGAKMVGTFTFTKDQEIKVLVGHEGTNNPSSSSSGGGGGSFVATHDNKPLIVAGGGGGTETATVRRPNNCGGSTSTSGRSGYGGLSWPGGINGHGATTADSSNSGGGGGGFFSNGRSSTKFGGSQGTGGEGGKGFVNGGVGGQAYANNIVGGFGGGGGAYGAGGGAAGGGGYSGGASGDNNNDSCGGGGGSYNSGSDQENVCCFNEEGHGYVLVTPLV